MLFNLLRLILIFDSTQEILGMFITDPVIDDIPFNCMIYCACKFICIFEEISISEILMS